MAHKLARAVATLSVSAALVAGPSAVNPASAAETGAAQCSMATTKVTRAQAKLKQAKRTGPAAKVVKAKAVLKKRKVDKKTLCSLAARQAKVIAKIHAVRTSVEAIRDGGQVTGLPADLRVPLTKALGVAVGRLRAAQTQAAFAGPSKLDTLVEDLWKYTPEELGTTLSYLADALTATGNPVATMAVVQGLGAPLPGGVLLPEGDAADLIESFRTTHADLTAYDGLGDDVVVSDFGDWFDDLASTLEYMSLDLQDYFRLLQQLGGTMPTDPAQHAALFAAVLSGGTAGGLPFAVPVDLDGVRSLVELVDTVALLVGGEYNAPDSTETLTRLGVPGALLELLELGGVA